MMIGGWDIIATTEVAPDTALRLIVEECLKVWPDAYCEDANSGDQFCLDSFDTDNTREIFISRDKSSSELIEKDGVTDDNANTFIHALMYSDDELTLVVHHNAVSPEIQQIVLNVLAVVNPSKRDEIAERLSRPLEKRYQ
jgi:hypothetical protein